MLCPSCGFSNQLINRFCGKCGALLPPSEVQAVRVDGTSFLGLDKAPRPDRRHEAGAAPDGTERRVVSNEPVRPPQRPARRPSVKVDSTIGGPSFLGIGKSDNSALLDEDYSEDDGGVHKWLLALVMVVLAVFFGVQWFSTHSEQVQRFFGHEPDKVVSSPSAQLEPMTAPSAQNPPAAQERQPALDELPGKPVVPGAGPLDNPSAVNLPASPEDRTATEAGAEKTAASAKTKEPEISTSKNKKSPVPAKKKSDTSVPSTAAAAEELPAVEHDLGERELLRARSQSGAGSVYWLWKAIAKGNSEAPLQLANMYLEGRGVAQNCEQALILLRSAAQHGSAPARSKLGALYASGTCVPQDRVTAYSYFNSALDVEPKNTYVDRNLDLLWAQMSGDERRRVMASAETH